MDPLKAQILHWTQFVQQRLATPAASISPDELSQMAPIIKAAKSSEAASWPEFRKMLDLLRIYTTTRTNKAVPAVPQPVRPVAGGMQADQSKLMQYQLMAYKYLSRNMPVPADIQEAISTLTAGKGLPRNGSVSQTVADATVTKSEMSTDGKMEPAKDAVHAPRTAGQVSTQRVMVPAINPIGLDPMSLVEEREQRIRAMVAARIAELESMVNDLPIEGINLGGDKETKSTKLNALIELKSLRLLEKQRRLRAEIVHGMKQSTSLQTAVSRSDYRRMKKPTVREIRMTERMEKQQRLEREKKEKQKHYEYLNSIVNHGRDMIANRRALAQKQMKLGRAVLHWHTNVEKEEQKRQERMTRERIKALKADDEEAYLKLIDKQKDTRLTHLLQQTDQYLSKLSDLVVAQQEDNVVKELEGARPSDFGMASDDPEIEKEDYFRIAHRISEKVTEQPSILVGGTLKDYQVKGLEWMVSLYNNRLNGILADEMGLGKTIQTIALVTFLIEKKNQNGPFLVIVPLSTITNWTLEFEKWAPSVVTVVYKGTPNQRREIQYSQLRLGTFNVVLTTYEYIIKDKAVLSKIKWVHTIIDEGHRMKNASSKLSVTLTQFYSSRYRLILTGTPLQNNLPELWALLNFVLPKVFNSLQSFDEWFNTPFANTGEKLELNEEEQLLIIKRLHKVLRPFLLRRLKTDVESDLPDKTERVLKTPLSALQQKLYSQVRKSGAMLYGGPSADGKKPHGVRSINNTIMQLRKICNHPFVFNEVEDSVNPEHRSDEIIVRTSGKFELLDRLLPKLHKTGHRVLIFFQMTAVMDIMEDFLRWKSFKYLRLDGSTKAEDRSGLLKLFNAPDSEYFVFILSTRAGGLGLNLQTADTVVIFDSDWNPHQDLQAQDRAHRIGQTKEVRIFRLISANSIEETILARAQYKLDLDGKIIQAGKFDNKSTNEERDSFLRSLFEEDPESNGDVNEVDDDEELNEILARNEDEMAVFRQIDQERQREDLERWRAKGKTGNPPRLISVDELPDIYLHEEVPVEEPAPEQLGRGRRTKSDIRYDDGLSDDAWAKAIDHDIDVEELAEKKRARAEKRKSKGKAKRQSSVMSSSQDAEEDSGMQSVEEQDGDESSPKKKKIRTEDNVPTASVDPQLSAVMTKAYEVIEASERSELFLQLPSRRDYPDYYQIIKNPIAMDMIRERIDQGDYVNLDQFRADFHLMFDNAMTYNVEGSDVYVDAQVLRGLFDQALQGNL